MTSFANSAIVSLLCCSKRCVGWCAQMVLVQSISQWWAQPASSRRQYTVSTTVFRSVTVTCWNYYGSHYY